MVTQQLDQAKTEAFAGQMVGMLNNAMTALLVSVGQRTGLFDKMAKKMTEEVVQALGH